MNSKKGFFYFTLDCIIASMIVFSFISTLQTTHSQQFQEIIITQKMHDLLTVWAKQKTTNINELESDFLFVFKTHSGVIELDGQKKQIKKQKQNQQVFSEETLIIDTDFKLKKLRLTVFD